MVQGMYQEYETQGGIKAVKYGTVYLYILKKMLLLLS